jgi:hypothetical protein
MFQLLIAVKIVFHIIEDFSKIICCLSQHILNDISNHVKHIESCRTYRMTFIIL